MLKTLFAAFVAFVIVTLGFVTIAHGQVIPGQNQLIPPAYFGQGYLLSSSTNPVHKITAAAVDLAGSFITGILSVPNGGTGANSFTSGLVLFGNGTSPIATDSDFSFSTIFDRLTVTNASTTVLTNSGATYLSLGNGGTSIGTTNQGARLQVNQRSSSDLAILLSGDGAGGGSTESGGFTMKLGFNANGNRQLWMGDSSQLGSCAYNSFRYVVGFDIPVIDGICNDGSTRRNISFGTDTSSVGVGFAVTKANTDIGAKLDVIGGGTGTGYAFRTSDSAYTPKFVIQDNGLVGIGSTTPGTELAIGTSNGINFVSGASTTATSTIPGNLRLFGNLAVGAGTTWIRDKATSTFSGGVDLLNGGCFAVNGTCITAGGGTGITAIGPIGQTQTGSTITIASSTTGTDFSITGSADSLTFNLPTASASNRGLLSSTDWSTFNNKLSSAVQTLVLPQGSFSGNLTIATSTLVSNGQTIGVKAVGSGSTITLTPTLTGTLNNAGLTNSTISGVSLGGTLGALTATDSTLTFSGSYTGAAARTVGLNLSNANSWLAKQTFSAAASSTLFSANYAQIGSTATTTFTTDGKLGIGTTSPFAKLSVAGDVALGVLGQANSIYAADNTTLTVGGGGNLEVYGADAASGTTDGGSLYFEPGDAFGSGDGGNFQVFAGSAPGSGIGGGFELYSGNSTSGFGGSILLNAGQGLLGNGTIVLNNGNVGVASTSPTALLTLEQDVESNSLWIGNQGSSSPSFVVKGVNGNGNVGIGTTSPWRAFSVTGKVALSGLTASSGTPDSLCINAITKEVTENNTTSCLVSSARFKHDIKDLTISGTDVVMELQPSTFAYNENDRKDIGFIAEEVALVDPRLADYDQEGKPWSLRIHAILAVTVKAVQENIKRDREQDEQIAELRAEIESLKKSSNSSNWACKL